VRRLVLLLSALACSGLPGPGNGGGGPDGGAPSIGSCPTSGAGAVAGAGACLTLTPALTGASPAGQNALRPSYALEPSGAPSGALVLLLNGSGGTPAGMVSDPSLNLFEAAAEGGRHVLALAYRSDLSVAGQLCGLEPECFGATRNTLVMGVFTSAASASLEDMREDEGIVWRLEAALRTLAAERPGRGWEAFLRNPAASRAADRVAWDRIITSGHSQGGGHAAYLAKLFPVMRVVQFSSTCDAPAGTPAPWTAAASGWSTSPADSFWGFSAPTQFSSGVPTGGDLNCPYHLVVWQAMGMPASRQQDDAARCAGIGAHGASILCTANFARWVELFR